MALDAGSCWEEVVEEIRVLEAIFDKQFALHSVRFGRGSGDGEGLNPGPIACADDLATLGPPPHPCDWSLSCSLRVECRLPDAGLRLVAAGPGTQADGVVTGPGTQADGVVTGPGTQAEKVKPGASTQAASSTTSSGTHSPPSAANPHLHHVLATVQCLPPLTLRLDLHAGYPAREPPRASLGAAWLDPGTPTLRLQASLAEQWEQGLVGGPVVHAWAEWLADHAVNAAGACTGGADPVLQVRSAGGDSTSNVLIGSRDHDSQTSAANKDSICKPPVCSMEELVAHDLATRETAWRAGEHTCGVCLEVLPGDAFVRLACGHAYCRDCLARQAELAVAEGALRTLRCPDPGCARGMDPTELRSLLSSEEYERWEALTLDRAIASMPDTTRCPRCGTPCIEDEDACARCPRCAYVFCALCAGAWHPGSACVSAATRLAMLRMRAEGVQDARGAEAVRAALRAAEAEAASVELLARETRPCPSCGVAVQRDGGCAKMTCAACGAQFCYRCGKEVHGYRHFGDGGCPLFDLEQLAAWERDWDAQVAAYRALRPAGADFDEHGDGAQRADARDVVDMPRAGGAGAGRRRNRPRRLPGVTPCPRCGQVLEKQGGNNHVLCWACTSHFCYLCRALLDRRGDAATHFGPTGCRQHSDD